MELARGIFFILFSLAMLAGMLQAVRLLGGRLGLEAETRRKLAHTATGIYALFFPLMFGSPWVVMALMAASVIMLAVLRLPVFARGGLSSALHGVSRASHGEIYLAIAIGLIFARSQNAPVLYVLPLLIITLSDAAAALVGVNYGRRSFMVESGRKSWEGSAAFFVLAWLIAMICLLLMTDIPRLNIIFVSLMAALVGTFVEAGSWKGLDNLFVPLAVHVFLARYMTAPPLTLALFALAFTTAALAALFLGRRFGVDRHAGRGFVILLFLMASITAPYNLVLPLAALIAHVAASRTRPALDASGDFAMLGMAAAVAILWYFAGEVSGRSAINLFSMTFATAGAALAALALTDWTWRAAAALGLAAICGLLTLVNEAPRFPLAWGLAACAAIATAMLLAGLAPGLFNRHRALRVFALSLAAPLCLFATGVFFA